MPTEGGSPDFRVRNGAHSMIGCVEPEAPAGTDLCLLDLRGNALERETCPDGSKDEDVFDIRQGVAIAFMVKKG